VLQDYDEYKGWVACFVMAAAMKQNKTQQLTLLLLLLLADQIPSR